MNPVNIRNYNNLLEIWDHREYLVCEYRLMHEYLILNNFNYHEAARQYELQVPLRLNRTNSPDYRVFQNLDYRMKTSGCLKPNHQYGGRHPRVSFINFVPSKIIKLFSEMRVYSTISSTFQVNEEFENRVIAAFLENPNLSTKVCALRLDSNVSEIHRILRLVIFKNNF